MENYREKMDKKVLEQLKDKIQMYLNRQGFKNTDFIRENMDKVVSLYVENSIEKGKSRMSSRGEKPGRPSEIMIDKSFATLDKHGKPIGIDKSVSKLIRTQLTHELIHSAARFKNEDGTITTGIQKNNHYRGLNEGMTQMFTEKIWGYTLSPNADSGYKDFKKIAKILDATFGEKVSLDSYFNHSDALEKSSNDLARNDKFYDDLNEHLSSVYYMNKDRGIEEGDKGVKKQDRDVYFIKLMNPIKDKMLNLLYEKVSAEIIIPKLKILSKDEKEQYLHNVLDSLKDEPFVLRNVSKIIVEQLRMDDNELQEHLKGIDNGLKKTEFQKKFIIDLYNGQDVEKLVEISNDGKSIKTKGKPSLNIKNEDLKEKIFAKSYFAKNADKKDRFNEKVERFCANIKDENEFKFGKKSQSEIDRKEVFSAMKVSAREKGYIVLNSLDECESGGSINIQTIEIKKNELVKFEDLRTIFEKYEMDYKNDSLTELYVKDRITGKEVTDPELEKMSKFASIWHQAAGTKWMTGENISGITYAFNEASENLYNKISEMIKKSMDENGSIDTEKIYKEVADIPYKHSESIVRNLLSNRGNLKIIYDFYKMQDNEAKLETNLSKSSNEFIYGYTAEHSVQDELEMIISELPSIDSKTERGQAQEQVIEKSQAQVERKQKDKEAEQRTEQQTKEFKESTSDKANQTLSKKSIRNGYIDSVIDGNEIQNGQKSLKEEINERSEMKRLQFLGRNRTPEQERRFQELQNIYQTNQQQVGKKKKKNGMNR